MKLKEAKEKYNSCTKVICLARGTEKEVVPGTVQRGFIDSKCFFMETTDGVFAMVVDNYENTMAKIVS